jgi:16S rRNA (guanine966-N2)-methyltransferase
MRIIAGTRKGMRLQAPPGQAVRPTSDLVRGAAMSQLGGFFEGGRVLDLCAGTGAVALEWLSRGCATAVCVERDPQVAQWLHGNVRHTRLEAVVEVRVGDVGRELQALAARGDRFDLVWFDPPYDAGLHATVLAQLAALPLIAEGGEVLVESRSGLEPMWLQGKWQVLSSRRYGACTLDRLRREDQP